MTEILTPDELDAIETRASIATYPDLWSNALEFCDLEQFGDHNIDFIAHAREDVPALLASHRAQAAQIKRDGTAIGELHDELSRQAKRIEELRNYLTLITEGRG